MEIKSRKLRNILRGFILIVGVIATISMCILMGWGVYMNAIQDEIGTGIAVCAGIEIMSLHLLFICIQTLCTPSKWIESASIT